MTEAVYAIRHAKPLTTHDDLEIELEDLSEVSEAALRHLLPKDVHKATLKSTRNTYLKDHSKLSLETKKTKSLGLRLLSWVVNTRVSVWTTANIFKSVRFWMLLGAPSQNTRTQTDKNLNQLTGSIHLAKTIHALSPVVAAWIQEKLIALKVHESLNAFLKGERYTLQTFVDVLLPIIYANIAKNIRECSVSDESEQQPVTLVNVISFACEIINRHLPYINQRLEVIEKVAEEKRDKVICHVFSHIVDEFLAIALPNGVEELPLIKLPIISQHFWKMIQKRVLPVIFYEIYRQLSIPIRENMKDLLLQRSGGESLVSLAQMAGDQAAELLPTILANAATETKEEDLIIVNESPLIEILTKSFCSLLEGSDLLKTWLSGWFTKELVKLGESENSHLKEMWKLLGGYLEPMLIHVFVHMSQMDIPMDKIKGRMPDAMGIIFIRFLSICSRFFNENQEKIQARVEQLKGGQENFKEDPFLLNIFEPLAHDLLCLMGLHDPSKLPLPDFVKETVVQHLKEIAPAFLLRQYFAITNSNTDHKTIQKKFRSLLFDPKNLEDPSVAIKVISALHMDKDSYALNMFNEFYRNLWQESGTEKIAKTLEAMCSVLASDIVDSVMQYFGIADQTLLKDDNNPSMFNFNGKIKSLVETTFLEMLIHLISTVEEKEYTDKANHPKCLLVANAVLQLTSIVNRRLHGLKKELGKIAEHHPQDREAYRHEAAKLFGELASDLHDFGGVDPFKHLPLDEFPAGDTLKEILSNSLKEFILPNIAYKTYLELVDWQTKIEDSFNELDKSYHTSHPKWACKVLAQYATDFIRHYLLNFSEEGAKLFLIGLKAYFNESTQNSRPAADRVLKELNGDAAWLISQNFSTLAATEDREFASVWPALTTYLEAIIAKFFAGFSKTIHEIELENPDFMVDVATQILKHTAEHFSCVTTMTEEAGVDQAFQVPLSDMLLAFGTQLHDGIPLDPSDQEEIKDLVRLKGCFIPLAAKLLKLSNLDVKDFPIPSIMRQQMAELAIQNILPLAMMRLYQKALEPQSRSTLMLHFVQILYAALNGVQPLKKEGELEEASSHPNPKQKHLYETCGSVVLELVKLIPDTTVQYVFMKEKVKNMSAEAIGDAIMPYLSRWTMLQIIDAMIYQGLPAFHPAKWEGKLGREDLIPRRAFVRPDGKMELKPVKEFKFDFPSTPAEVKALEESKAKEAAKVRKELRDGFTKTMSQQLYAKVWDFVKSLWLSLQEQLSDVIESLFPEKGLEVKATLDKIFRKIFFDIWGSIIQFLASPLIAFVKFMTEKTIIDRRSEDIIENLQSEALENLFYKWTDTVIDMLLRLQKKPQTAT